MRTKEVEMKRKIFKNKSQYKKNGKKEGGRNGGWKEGEIKG